MPLRQTDMTAPAHRLLARRLGALDVYVMGVGTTLGAGFFVLPGLAAAEVGRACSSCR